MTQNKPPVEGDSQNPATTNRYEIEITPQGIVLHEISELQKQAVKRYNKLGAILERCGQRMKPNQRAKMRGEMWKLEAVV